MPDASISFPILGDFSINPSRYFTLFGHNFYWYGVIIASGFLLAVLYMLRRKKDFGFTSDDIFDFLLAAVPVGIIGARVYYIVFHFDTFRDATVWKTLWNMCKIWEGGLAIYGGIIFGAIGLLIYCRVKKVPMGAALDVASFGVIIGQTVGRWGNFMNREAFGYTENIDTFFLRMGLTTPAGITTYWHPTFLYESVWNIAGLVILHVISKKRKFDGQVFASYIAWYGLGRTWIEGLRTDSLMLIDTDFISIRVSQMLAALTFILALIYLVYRLGKKKYNISDMHVNRRLAAQTAAAADADAESAGIAASAEETIPEDNSDSHGGNDAPEDTK